MVRTFSEILALKQEWKENGGCLRLGGGEMESYYLIDTEFQLGKIKFRRGMVPMVAQQCECT